MFDQECQKEIPILLLTMLQKSIKIGKKITTWKVNVVGYVFPPERACHRLRAGSGFRCMSKFGTGVAFKISLWKNFTGLLIMIEEKPEQSVIADRGVCTAGLNLGGTTMLSSLSDGGFFCVQVNVN